MKCRFSLWLSVILVFHSALGAPPETLPNSEVPTAINGKTSPLSTAVGDDDSATRETPYDSVLTDLLGYLRENPKAQWVTSTVVVGETILAGMLWKRMKENRAHWTNQLATVRGVESRLQTHNARYLAAEKNLVRTLNGLERAQLQSIQSHLPSLPLRTRSFLERTLFPEATQASSHGNLKSASFRAGKAMRSICDWVVSRASRSLSSGAKKNGPPASLSVEESQSQASEEISLKAALSELETSYSLWQEAAAREVEVLKAAGRGEFAPPPPLQQISNELSPLLHTVNQLGNATENFHAFQEEGTSAIADAAKAKLGDGLSWKKKLSQKSRTPALMLAMPLIVLAIMNADDRQQWEKRRQQDLAESNLADRDKWLNTFIPYFHRPLLFTIVKAWTQVSQRPESPLKLPCPYSLQDAPLDNPDLVVIQSLAMQTLLEMETKGEGVVATGKKKSVTISPQFYRNLFQKILETENSPLLKLPKASLDDVLDELSLEAYHGFDRLEFAPENDFGSSEPLPPLGLSPRQ